MNLLNVFIPISSYPIRVGDYFIYEVDGDAWNGDKVYQNDWIVARGFGTNVTWENVRYYTDGELIFVEGNSIYTSSGAQAVIESYEDQILTVHTNTPNLVLAGDTFFDAKQNVVEILTTEVIPESLSRLIDIPFSVGTNTFLGDFIPEDEDTLEVGDLWWSEQTGRLYIYNGNEWICTQPIGTKPMIGASNHWYWNSITHYTGCLSFSNR